MANTDYALGLAVGILAALVVFFIVWKFNKTRLKGSFDERQELVRGRGYKYSFFVTLVLLGLDLIADIAGVYEATVLTQSLAIFTIIIISVVTYAVYCICNDSYFGQGMDARSYKAIMWVIIVMNGVSAFLGAREGLIQGGKLAFGPVSQGMFVLAFVIIMIALAVRSRQQKLADSEDE